MGILFSWLYQPDVPLDGWNAFLDKYSLMVCAIVVITIGWILYRYRARALSRVINFPTDIFASYRPMRALLWCCAGAGFAAMLFFFLSDDALQQDHYWFRVGFSAELFVLVSAACAFLAWLCIAFFFPGLTPPRFRYRRGPFGRHRKMAAN